MKDYPKISVAMATYNGARFIREQLDSIARQRVLPVELHIGDDGSTDETEEIVREFAGRAPFEVTFIRNRERLGFGENFLRTALRCRGDWVSFSDQDDIWLPKKLARVAEAIGSAPDDTALITHNAILVDEAGRALAQNFYGYPGGTFPPLTLAGAWLCAGFLQTFRTSLVNEFALWPRAAHPGSLESDPPGMVRHPHDRWIAVIANATGTIVRLDEALVLYRRHSNTVTGPTGGLPSLALSSAQEKIRLALSGNGRSYCELARWYEDTADVLVEHRKNATPEIHARLDKAIIRFGRESSDLAKRCEMYGASRFADRFKLLLQLLRSGAYGRRGTMRPASAIKDFVCLIGAPGRRPARAESGTSGNSVL